MQVLERGPQPDQNFNPHVAGVLKLFESGTPPGSEREYLRDHLAAIYLSLGGDPNTSPKHLFEVAKNMLIEVVDAASGKNPNLPPALVLASQYAMDADAISAGAILEDEKHKLVRPIKALTKLLRVNEFDFKEALEKNKQSPFINRSLIYLAKEIIDRGRGEATDLAKKPKLESSKSQKFRKKEMVDISQDISERVLQLRKKLNFPQSHVWGRKGQAQVSAIETGRRKKVGRAKLSEIASKYGVTAEDIISGGPSVDIILQRPESLVAKEPITIFAPRPKDIQPSHNGNGQIAVLVQPKLILGVNPENQGSNRLERDRKKIDAELLRAIPDLKKSGNSELIIRKGEIEIKLTSEGVLKIKEGGRERTLSTAQALKEFGYRNLSSWLWTSLYQLGRKH